jgi:D-glycero-alpha-D-manno-heptose 1-phosphate guanylyltransferase
MELRDHSKIKMQIIILCGGLGTRLRSLIGDTPKSLAPMKSKKFIDYQLDFLNRFEVVSEVLLLTGHGASELEEHIDVNLYNFTISFNRDSKDRLGTFGALREASGKQLIRDDFLLLFGDSIPNCDLPAIYFKFRDINLPVGLTYISKKIVEELANVELESNKVIYHQGGENKQSNFVDYGVTYFQNSIFLLPESQQFSDLKHFLGFYTKYWNCSGLELFEPFFEIGTVTSYAKAMVEFPYG